MMTTKVFRLLGLILIGLARSVNADEFNADGILVVIPAKFEGPVTAQSDENVRTYAFIVPMSSPMSSSTVLQITAYDAEANVQPEDAGNVSQRYLAEMLEGIERRRTDYQRSELKDFHLAGYSGSAASWQGKANGIGTNGKMFCIITSSKVLFFHVMGSGSTPNADMVAAITAVESARKF